jgi:hypothetical protein
MSTLTYTNSQYAAPSTATTAATPLWRRAFNAVIQSRQRRADREIAAYLQSHGGLLTDDLEREIMSRLQGRRGVSF